MDNINTGQDVKQAAKPGDLVTVTASRIEPVPIRPLWRPLLYRGKVTVIAGDPGGGKSLTSIDLTARITAGAPWPDDRGRFEPASATMITTEDDHADTVRPRLDVAGANTDLVEFVLGVSRTDKDGTKGLDPVSLMRDLPRIEKLLRERGDAILTVDPLTSYAGDTNKTQTMRMLLDRLGEMAGRTDVAVVVITHPNKRSDATKALQVIAGSHVIGAAPRVVMLLAEDPEDSDRQLLLKVKNNLEPKEGGLAFRFQTRSHSVCGDVPGIEWEKSRVTGITADAVVCAPAKVPRLDAAKDWLRDYLAGGPIPQTQVESAAVAAGHTARTLRRAKDTLGVVAEKAPGAKDSPWIWKMPNPIFGHLGHLGQVEDGQGGQGGHPVQPGYPAKGAQGDHPDHPAQAGKTDHLPHFGLGPNFKREKPRADRC